MDINKNHHHGSNDGDQIPGCWACQFIGRICPPDCPLAPHFDTGLTHAAAIARIGSILIGKIVIEFARSFPQESRRIYVKSLVTVAAIGTYTGEEGCRPLVEAVLSEIEKELEQPTEPKPALCSAASSSSSSTDPQLPSALEVYQRSLDDVANGRADLSDFLNAFNDALSTLIKPDDSEKP